MLKSKMHPKRRNIKNSRDYPASFFFNNGLLAAKKGHDLEALNNYLQAVTKAPENYKYKIQLCSQLSGVSFLQFNLKVKSIILDCLKTPHIDYQNLWKPCFSMLMCDPRMEALQNFINGHDYHHKKLQSCLSEPYFLNGLKRFIVFDMRFELALKKLQNNIEEGAKYPEGFIEALAIYCFHSEYVFCEHSGEQSKYKIDESILTLSASESAVSKGVRAQYEVNPYPRWVSCNVQEPPESFVSKTHDHLIAGCGTGYGACLTAILYPNARIVAVDLSLASLSYAKQKAEELGLGNITFYQADILNLEKLDQTFDIIECSGVLHHMADPVEGWGCLMEKLKPDGRMHIGLYSELARADIVAARRFIAEQKFEATHAGIQEARQEIYALPEEHPARAVLSRRDFYSTSSCRDLLFHMQEHRFTISELQESFDRLGLTFEGFDIQKSDTLNKYRHMFPDDKKMLDLKNWEEFEVNNPSTFRGMYQFWCAQKE